MTHRSTLSRPLIARYVTALLDAAHQAGRLLDVSSGSRDLIAMIDGSAELRFVLSAPMMSSREQIAALNAVMSAAKIDPLLAGFVRVVMANRRGAGLRQMLAATLEELARRDGIAKATVEVAAPMTDMQQKRLADMLSAWSGARVHLNVRVTPEVLGGIKIRMGSIQIDDSIAGKLDRLRQTLVGTAANA